MKKPDAIFFDWDGTLIDGFDVIFNGHNAALAAFDLPQLSPDQMKLQIRLSAREAYPKVFGANAEAATKVYYDYVRSHHLQHVKELSGSKEFLEFLKRNQIKAGVVSNKTHPLLEQEIAHFGWNEFFGTILGAGIAARDKPAPDPLIQAAANIGLNSRTHELWYIGDTETDMQAAHAAEFKPVFLAHGLGTADQLGDYAPDLSFADMMELQTYLQKSLDFSV